ncbi:hypothetical protein C8F04DRAFT_1065334 [Mycena alexandri]|uniref:WW domain-containing protein n=1 Tax=Mycena alexandri TaxID=1745969 RepID=A0AAD6THV4_9AGAR|nr:hypothetical protein C8F04DRAFT_1065334 [Mycena alexandri]
MPPPVFLRILAKLRAMCGGFHSLHFRFIWSILKRLIRWMPTTHRSGDRKPPASDPLAAFMRLSRAPTTPQIDLHSIDLGKCVFPHEAEDGDLSPQLSTNEGWVEYGRNSTSSSASQTRYRDSTSTRGVDRLQPTTMAIPRTLRPIRPENLLRYQNKTPVSTKPANFIVKPLQIEFRSESSLPPEWEAKTQSEGQVFFYNEKKNIITETWLYNPGWCEQITSFIEVIDNLREKNELNIPQDAELVLEIQYDEDFQESYCGYYFAHHETRCIFWLHDTRLDEWLEDIKGGRIPPEHAKILLEREYWRHFAIFERIHETPMKVLCEVRAIILDASTDLLVSHVSTVNHSKTQLEDMAKIIEGAIKDLKAGGRGCPFSVGRIMSQFHYERFVNFYGQEAARICRNKSVHGKALMQDSHSWLMKILSRLLFNAPQVQLIGFDRIWVDEIAAREPWIKQIERLTSEWAEHTTFATILLNANVAFLDVPGVESGGPSQSLSQIFFYISIVLVLGSAILGLILKRQHSTKHLGTAPEAADFLSSHDLETTAIIYSLPYALLMYGLVFFSAAFMLTCFLSTSSLTRWTVGIFLAFTSTLIVWCLLWQAFEDSTGTVTWWEGKSFKWHGFRKSERRECEKDDEMSVAQEVNAEKGFTPFDAMV